MPCIWFLCSVYFWVASISLCASVICSFTLLGIFNVQLYRSFQCILLLMGTCLVLVFGYYNKCKIRTYKDFCEHIIWFLLWIAWSYRKWIFNFIRSLQTFFPKWWSLSLRIAPHPLSVSSQHALGQPLGCSLSLELGLPYGEFCLSEIIWLFH